MSIATARARTRLPPEVNRVLYIRNLPFNFSAEDLYNLFGKFGAVRQIRQGSGKETRGTAYVVYEDIFDAKTACEHLSGFNVSNRYLIVLYYNPIKHNKKLGTQDQEERIRKMQVGGATGLGLGPAWPRQARALPGPGPPAAMFGCQGGPRLAGGRGRVAGTGGCLACSTACRQAPSTC
jgi:pre-mRNA branch site protein p14